MDRRTAAVVALLVLVLTLGAVPRGDARPPGRIPRATVIARRVFPTRCAGPIQIRFGVRPDTRRGVTLATAFWRRSHRPGAPFTRCVIVLNRRALTASRQVPFPVFCSVILHEYGHLAGRRHSGNPRSIMYATTHVDSRCLPSALSRASPPRR